MEHVAKVEIDMGEADAFSNTGSLLKKFNKLPEGIYIGAGVQIGHWRAECISIQRQDTMEHPFVVGFKMRF